MGLDRTAAEALCAAKSLGAGFDTVLTIGRQWLGAPRETIEQIAAIHRASFNGVAGSRFAEPLFRMLGAKRVDSLDISDFEGATICHDMNLPLPGRLRQAYDLVFDGGSLEHVFNVPQALRNCMEAVRVGGYFVQVNNGNNFMGHGFWQFSPELLYRTFSPENGFETLGVFARPLRRPFRQTIEGPYFLARDPKALGWRVELANRHPTYLVTIARRVADKPVFEQFPQQSDYVALWAKGEDGEARSPALRDRLLAAARTIVPPGIEQRLRSPFHNKAYVRVSTDDLMAGRLPGAWTGSA